MLKLANIQVAARLWDTPTAPGHLPSSRASSRLCSASEIALNTEDSIQKHEYDYCMESLDGDELIQTIQASKLLRQLFYGVSVGIVGMGIESEKVGKFSNMLIGTLCTLQKLIEEQGEQADIQVALSYGVFAVSDSSCIDLLTYSRKDVADIEQLVQEWCPLTSAENVDDMVKSIRQGYSLPCIVLVRLFVKNSNEDLPGAMSTLILADLGSVSSGGALEKSFALLKSHILTLDQVFISHGQMEGESPNRQQNFLTAFLERCFGEDMATLIVADIPKFGNARSIQSFAQLLDSIRRVKNRPTSLLETPEMLELNLLVESHGKLEVEHRAIRRELKQLQRALRVTEMQREALLSEQEMSLGDRDVERFDYQYELAKINMEKIQIHERIRQCEIDLVCMEHERLLLLAEMNNKQRQLAELEGCLRSSVLEKEKIKEEYSREVQGLAARLESASKQLETAEQEKCRLQNNLDGATSRITDLQKRIDEVEQAKAEIESSLQQKNAANSKQLETKLADLAKLRMELDRAKDNETQLQKRLGSLEATADTYKTSVSELEARLAAMKVENITLHAKLEVLAMKPQSPEVSRTIRAMEDKWVAERTAMHSVMSELRQMINEKNVTSSLSLVTDDKILPSAPASKKSRLSSVFTEHPKENSQTSRASVGRRKSVTFVPPLSSSEPDTPVRPSSARGGHKSLAKHEKSTVNPSLSPGKKGGGKGKSAELSKKAAVEIARSSELVKRELAKVLPSHRRGKKDKESVAAPPAASIVERIKGNVKNSAASAAAPSVKLGKAKTVKNTVESMEAPSKVQTVDRALSKLLDEVERGPGDIVIPGTPPKGIAPTPAPNNPASPGKVWKPSAFIPGLARKPLSGGSNEQSGGSKSTNNIFAGLSFAAGGSDEGFRKRIKLPERAKPNLLAAVNPESVSQGEGLHRRNLDTSIMNSFNIPTAKSK